MNTLLARHALACIGAISTILPAAAQARPTIGDVPQVLIDVRYSATRAHSPPGSCGCFLLQGAALDAALPLGASFSAAAEIAGGHASVVPASTRPLSTLTLLAGPRYTLPLGRHQAVFAQGLFGAVRGFDAEFRRGADAIDTATAFAYTVGGGYEFQLSHAVSVRPVQVDLLQTNLPNGADNRQRDLRFGAGVSFRVPLGSDRRH